MRRDSSTPDFAQAREYALNRLEHQLPPHLYYHSLWHTRDDVLVACRRLAYLEGLTEKQHLLLYTAALYHDVGFTIQVVNHEAISSQIATDILPGFGYSQDDIAQICGMIMVTKVFTMPKTQMEAILVDADLDVLGREDFFKRNDDLRRETQALGKFQSEEQWLLNQLKFMDIHKYRTISAQSLRNRKKQEYRCMLEQQLVKLDHRHS